MRYHVVDTWLGGEIVHESSILAPLRHKPKGRLTRPKHTWQPRRPVSQLEQDVRLAVVVLLFVSMLAATS